MKFLIIFTVIFFILFCSQNSDKGVYTIRDDRSGQVICGLCNRQQVIWNMDSVEGMK